MGLAPYGEPRFHNLIRDNLIDLKPDGSFRLDMSYFNYCTGLTMTNEKFDRLLGLPARAEGDALTQQHMDIAASAQAVLEEAVLALTRALAAEYRQPNLCLAGGVALNCVANGKILRDGKFKRIWIQPAAGDAGGSLGAALAAYYAFSSGDRKTNGAQGVHQSPHNDQLDQMAGCYLGPSFTEAEIRERLWAEGARFDVIDDEATLLDVTAQALRRRSCGRLVSGADGVRAPRPRQSLDPRRSALARDAEDPEPQGEIPRKPVPSRRPCSPRMPPTGSSSIARAPTCSGRRCRTQPWLRGATRRPGSGRLDRLKAPRSEIPAVTHVDFSARIQTVHRATNPRFHGLLRGLQAETGCPVLVNTSFNVRGERSRTRRRMRFAA